MAEVAEEEEARRLADFYDLQGVLGTGGFSVVQKAVAKEDGSLAAVKTLKKHRGPSVSNALVENEILVMNKIVETVSPHPNVIHLFDVFEDDDSIHLVLELCSGGELFDRIVQQERYSEAGAAAIVRQIASGLAALHANNISHRDLKPENCLFLTPAEDSPLKLMDFGLSSVEGQTSPLVGLFGSIDYVAPESLSKRDSRAPGDMWSLGVILYILLCGYPPFHATSNRAKQQLILSASFDFDESTWNSISSSAKQLIKSLLAVDPAKRPTAAELLLHPWVRGDAAKQDPMEPQVKQRLKTFNARRKFRAAAYASIATNQLISKTKALRKILGGLDHVASGEELKELHGHFKRISANGSSVSLPEFQEVLKAMSMGSLVPVSPRIFELFDDDKNGAVDTREIMCGFASLRSTQGDEALRLCFKMYDADDSGYISREELAEMLKALPQEFLPPDILEPGILDEFFDRMDANCDGRLSFEEFKAAIHADHFLVDALLQPARGESPGVRPPARSPGFKDSTWEHS